MIPPTWSEEERAAFWRGFNLACPPGDADRDALGYISRKVGPPGGGGLRIAIPEEAAISVVDATEGLPENLSSATWIGFVRGMVAKAGGEAVYLHEGGTA